MSAGLKIYGFEFRVSGLDLLGSHQGLGWAGEGKGGEAESSAE